MENFKKLVSMTLAFAVLTTGIGLIVPQYSDNAKNISSLQTVYASDDSITVNIDGKKVDFSKYGQEPFIENATTYVPLRSVFESFGAEDVTAVNTPISSDKQEFDPNVFVFQKNVDGFDIEVAVNIKEKMMPFNSYYTANYKKEGQSGLYGFADSDLILKDGRTFVPIRLISEIFGYDVDWDSSKKNVNIDTSNPSCNTFDIINSQLDGTVPVEVEKSDEETKTTIKYISLTATDMNYKNYYYSVELDNYNKNEILKTDDTSQYPLGVIDLKNEKVYYTYRFDGSDQIMSYNIKNKTTEKLTTDLFAVNQIIPVDEYLYIIATTNKNNMLQLLKFDIKTNSYITITDDETMVSYIAYCKSDNSIYFTSYNWNNQIALNEKFEKFPKQYPEALASTNTISKYDCNGGETTKVFERDMSITKIGAYNDGNNALIRASETLFSLKSFYLIDFSSNEVIGDVDFGDMVRIDNFSFGEKGLYFTGIANPDKNFDPNSLESVAPPNALYLMDMDSREITYLASFEDKYINNFVVFE